MKVLKVINYLDLESVSETQIGRELDISGLLGLAVHVIWTSTTSKFTVKLQLSNDGENWVDEPLVEHSIEDNSDQTILNYPLLYALRARVVVEQTSGSLDTLKVHVSGKDR